jgi:hypothetical protein
MSSTELKGCLPPLAQANRVPLIEDSDHSEVVRVREVWTLRELRGETGHRDREGRMVVSGEASVSQSGCLFAIQRCHQGSLAAEGGSDGEHRVHTVEETGVDEHLP